MAREFDKVGRIFADAQLSKRVGPSSSLCSAHASSAPTPIQKTCLYAVKNSTTPGEFTSAIRAAVKHSALTPVASTFFSPSLSGGVRYIPRAPEAMFTRIVPTQVDSPMDVQLDSPVDAQVDVQVDAPDALSVEPVAMDLALDDLGPPAAVAGADRTVHIVPRNIGGNALVSPQRKRRNKAAKK